MHFLEPLVVFLRMMCRTSAICNCYRIDVVLPQQREYANKDTVLVACVGFQMSWRNVIPYWSSIYFTQSILFWGHLKRTNWIFYLPKFTFIRRHTISSLCMLYVCFVFVFRLEELNEKRASVVQMVKLAEKERESLEVRLYDNFCALFCFVYVVNEFSDYFTHFTRVSRMKPKNTCLKNCLC